MRRDDSAAPGATCRPGFPCNFRALHHPHRRCYLSRAVEDLVVRAGVVVPERELVWAAVRSSGPGGQNVNKVSSKVELRFDFEATDVLTPSVKTRLRALAQHRLDADGCILIVSQVTRTQPQNLADARQRLSDLIALALVVPKVRRATKPSRAAKRARLKNKRAQSDKKQSRARRASDD
jgi:ribosome-associated protein